MLQTIYVIHWDLRVFVPVVYIDRVWKQTSTKTTASFTVLHYNTTLMFKLIQKINIWTESI